MRRLKLAFEIKLLLVFGTVLLVVLYFGAGNLSFEEAVAKASEDKSSFSPETLSRLEQKQARFTDQAFPPCLETTGIVPDNFTVVIEIGSNGQVARSWRQGDSEFVICFQRIMTEYFDFRSIEQPFFTAFEYTGAS
jgi:hypothetical protein